MKRIRLFIQRKNKPHRSIYIVSCSEACCYLRKLLGSDKILNVQDNNRLPKPLSKR